METLPQNRKRRARALIIKDGKLLLVSGLEAGFYWVPGGGVEAGETVEDALAREVREELGAAVKSARLYKQLEFTVKDKGVVEENYYLVEVKGEIHPGEEVSETIWYGQQDFKSGAIPTSDRVPAFFADLIRDGLITD